MTRYLAFPLAAVLGIAAAPRPAHAHHSYALFFDLCTTVTIEGRVDAFEWKEPHVMIHLTLDDGTSHRAEWGGPRGLANRGIQADVLKTGDRVVITGSPWKDRAQMEPATRALVSDPPPKLISALTQVRRADRSWSWKPDAMVVVPADCARK